MTERQMVMLMASILASGDKVMSGAQLANEDSPKETVKQALGLMEEVYNQLGPEPEKEEG